MTIKRNFIKQFIQLHVSTPWGHLQAAFQNILNYTWFLFDRASSIR